MNASGLSAHWEKMQGTWETLQDVAGRFPDHATIQYRLAKGALRAMIFDRTRQRRLEMGKTLGDFGGRAKRFPERDEIQEMLKQGRELLQ